MSFEKDPQTRGGLLVSYWTLADSTRPTFDKITRAKPVQESRHRCDTTLCCHATTCASFVQHCWLVFTDWLPDIFHVLSRSVSSRRSTMKLALIALLLPSAFAAVKKTAANAKETAFLEE